MLVLFALALAVRVGVTAVVLDPTGAAVAGATVRVEVNGALVTALQTSGDGRIDLPDAAPGTMVLRVTAPGFAETVVRVADAAVDADPLRIVLQPAGVFETVTVTASRSDARLSAPSSTTVLTATELTHTPSAPVDDILRNTPGFSLTRRASSRTANPSTQGVSMRGLAGNAGSRTLVLADGLALNDAFGGWVYWNRIPEAAVERIEVVRGAAGDLYGGDAITGVIQLLTFSPQTTRLRATADAGSAATRRGSVYAGGQRGGWNAAAAGEWLQTDGEPIVASAERGPVDVPAFSNYRTALASAGYDAGAGWRAGGRLAVYQEARGNGTPLVTNDTNWRQFSATASGNVAGGSWSAQVGGGRQHYFNNFSSVPASRTTERVTNEQRLPSTFVAGAAQWVRPIGGHVALLGVETKHTDATVYDTPFSPAGARGVTVVTGGAEQVTSTYGRVALHAGSSVTIVAGARGDFWRSTPEESGAPRHAADFFSPRVSAAWQAAPDVVLRATATHAWRTPTLDELHRSSRIGNTLTLGNPVLDPESLTGLEAGMTAGANSRASVSASWFWNDLTDAITNVTIATTPSQITRRKQNADNVRAKGLEVDVGVRASGGLKATAGLVWTSSRFRHEVQAPALEGNRVPQIPSVQFNGSVTWTGWRALTLATTWHGSNRQFEDDLNTLPLDGYGVLDAYVGRTIARGVEAFGACENVFDSEYQTGKTGNPPVTKVGWPRSYRVGIHLALP